MHRWSQAEALDSIDHTVIAQIQYEDADGFAVVVEDLRKIDSWNAMSKSHNQLVIGLQRPSLVLVRLLLESLQRHDFDLGQHKTLFAV